MVFFFTMHSVEPKLKDANKHFSLNWLSRPTTLLLVSGFDTKTCMQQKAKFVLVKQYTVSATIKFQLIWHLLPFKINVIVIQQYMWFLNPYCFKKTQINVWNQNVIVRETRKQVEETGRGNQTRKTKSTLDQLTNQYNQRTTKEDTTKVRVVDPYNWSMLVVIL